MAHAVSRWLLRRLVVLAGLVALLCAPGGLDQAVAGQGGEGRIARFAPLFIETSGGIVSLRVEVADSDFLRRRGLMNRQRLPRGQGMLLLWSRPTMAAIWMKNTLIPLDILFIDAEGRIVHVHEGARPGDLTPIAAGRPVLAVLEIGAGEARRLGLKRGDRAALPGLGGLSGRSPGPQPGRGG